MFNMSYAEFRDLCFNNIQQDEEEGLGHQHYSYYDGQSDGYMELFGKYWVTGGVDGGNCWEEGGHYDIRGEDEPDYLGFEKTIKQLRVTKAQRASIMKCEVSKDASESGYYGNYTDAMKKHITFLDIYLILRGA